MANKQEQRNLTIRREMSVELGNPEDLFRLKVGAVIRRKLETHKTQRLAFYGVEDDEIELLQARPSGYDWLNVGSIKVDITNIDIVSGGRIMYDGEDTQFSIITPDDGREYHDRKRVLEAAGLWQ